MQIQARIVNVNGSSVLGPNELSIYLDRIFAPLREEAVVNLQPGRQPIIALIKEPEAGSSAARA